MIDKTCYELKGTVPSKKNSKRVFVRYGKPIVLPSEAYGTWHADASWQLKAQRPKPVENVQRVHLRFYGKDRRPHDLSNKAESVMDLLVDMGVLVDDNWFEVSRLDLEFCGIDRENPRVEIIIYS